MPTRIIRDGILTSERVNALSERAELFYRRLMSVVDDYGRFSANLTLLRASCYPLKLDSVKEDSIKKHLAEAEDAGLIVLYMVAAKAYVQLQDFGQRVQSKSKYPEPTSDSRESTVDNREEREKTALVVVEDEVVVEGEKPRAKRRSKPETSPLPDDFGISDSVKTWAVAKGHSRLSEHLESFRAKAKAKGYTYADWDAAFMEAIRNDWARISVANGGSPQYTATKRPEKRQFPG